MNDGRVIRQALGDAGRTWVRRALEQGYELSEVARATVRLDDGEVFGYYPATFRVDDLSDLERSLFSSVGPFPAKLAADSEDAVIQQAREVGGDLRAGRRAACVGQLRSPVSVAHAA